MRSKVFVHLTLLELPQVIKTFLKIFVWSEHLIKIHLDYYEMKCEVYFTIDLVKLKIYIFVFVLLQTLNEMDNILNHCYVINLINSISQFYFRLFFYKP